MARKTVLALILSVALSAAASAVPAWNSVDVLYPTGVTRDTSGVLYVAGSPGVYRSADTGATWQLLPTDTNLADGFAITVNPVTNDIFIAVESGVYRSSDDGATWVRLANMIVGAYAMAVRGDGLILAAGSIGFARSLDNGDTWTVTANIPGPLHNAIAFSKNGTCFIGSLLDGLYRSTDDGLNWENISASFGAANQFQDVVVDTANGYVYATSFHMFFQEPTYNKVFRSADDGTTWTAVDSVSGISLSLGVDRYGHVFSGRTPTAYSDDHGATWTDVSSGIQQGDRLVEFMEAAPGVMILADMDDSLKILHFDAGILCGDADGSGALDVADVVYLVTFLFQGGPAPTPPAAGDMDGNPGITVSDLVYLVAHEFQGGPPPMCP